MSGNLTSVDRALTAAQTYGMWRRLVQLPAPGTATAATTSCGYISACRFPTSVAIPAPGSGLVGAYLTYCRMLHNAGGSHVMFCVLEYLLGTLTVSGNSFAAGVSMPSNKIINGQGGSGVQTRADFCVAYVDTAMTATTPVLTTTYTNERGTASRTCTMTLPTNAVANSAYLTTPHLQSGDTGVQSVSSISISTGTAGVVKLTGCLVLATNVSSTSANANGAMIGPIDPLTVGWPLYLIESTDTIAFYRFGNVNNQVGMAALAAIAESS